MKIKIFILLTFYFTFTNVIAQQDVTVQKRYNFFYVGPVNLFFNTIQLGYERKVSHSNSIGIITDFKFLKHNNITERIGGSIEFQYKVNLFYNKETLNPVVKNHSIYSYFAPFVQYRYERATDIVQNDIIADEKKETFINSGFAGFGFGVRLTAFQNRFCANLFAGSGLKFSDLNGDEKYSKFFEPGYTGVYPKLAFQIGISF